MDSHNDVLSKDPLSKDPSTKLSLWFMEAFCIIPKTVVITPDFMITCMKNAAHVEDLIFLTVPE